MGFFFNGDGIIWRWWQNNNELTFTNLCVVFYDLKQINPGQFSVIMKVNQILFHNKSFEYEFFFWHFSIYFTNFDFYKTFFFGLLFSQKSEMMNFCTNNNNKILDAIELRKKSNRINQSIEHHYGSQHTLIFVGHGELMLIDWIQKKNFSFLNEPNESQKSYDNIFYIHHCVIFDQRKKNGMEWSFQPTIWWWGKYKYIRQLEKKMGISKNNVSKFSFLFVCLFHFYYSVVYLLLLLWFCSIRFRFVSFSFIVVVDDDSMDVKRNVMNGIEWNGNHEDEREKKIQIKMKLYNNNN